MDGHDTEVDRLESSSAGPLPRRLVAAIVLAVLVAAAAVVTVWHRTQGARTARSAAPAGAAQPAGPTVSEPAGSGADDGSVFLVPLPQCTHVDGTDHLRIAFSIVNLASRRLQLVDVRPDAGDGLRRTAVDMWTRPCAHGRLGTTASLAPSGRVVVDMGVAVAGCPSRLGVSVVVTFRAGGRTLAAQSTSLVDLGRLHLAPCHSR